MIVGEIALSILCIQMDIHQQFIVDRIDLLDNSSFIKVVV
jgi:hypothetical protein